MIKGLEALTELRNIRQETYYALDIKLDDKIDEDLDTIEKELKALEIISNKVVDIFAIKKSKNIAGYLMIKNFLCGVLTQEEYDLLNEVLFNGKVK